MIKILHSADIHLDSPLASLALRDPDLQETVAAATRGALRRIVQVAIDDAVAALLISGDLFDGAARSAHTAAFLVTELDRLRAAGIAVFYIKGNHDAENPITGQIGLPANVHVFDGRGGRVQIEGQDIWIHGVSFAQKHAPDSLLTKFPAPVPGAVNIAMLHSSLSGAAGHDAYAPCSVADLKTMGFDYWALGHVHKRHVHSSDPWVVMPGMPQGRDIGEDGPKSATLLHIEDGCISVTTVPTAQVTFLRHGLDISGIDTEDRLRATLKDTLGELAATSDAEASIVRLTLAGRTPLAWALMRDRDTWTDIVDRMARDTASLWLEKLVLDLATETEDRAGAGAVDELARLMHDIAAEPGFAAWRDAEVETLLQTLPPDRRAALLPDAEALTRHAKRFADAGAAAMVARMKGSGV